MLGLEPDLAFWTTSTRPLKTFLYVDAVLVSEMAVTFFRPVGELTPLSLSTVSMAGPLSKKSTRMKLGCRLHASLHLEAASPRFPVPPEGAFVVET